MNLIDRSLLKKRYTKNQLLNHWIWKCHKCGWVGIGEDAKEGSINGRIWTESAGGYWIDTHTDPWCPNGCIGELERNDPIYCN